MLYKTLVFGYVFTVGTNPDQKDFENWVLSVAVNTCQISGVPRTNQTSQMARKRHSILNVSVIPTPSSYTTEM